MALLWRFSRPHTLLGTGASIIGIYLLAAAHLDAFAPGDGLGDLALTLLAGAAVNVFIVGVNQLEDIAIDRVNKPHLPLAAGDLSVRAGRRIVATAFVLPVLLGITQGWVELTAVLAAMAIGAAYSLPPLRLKRHPALAASSISVVRAFVVNLGVYLHFADSLGGSGELSPIPGPIVALTLFVIPFALAIAVLKDVPDVEGDRRYEIATFTVRVGARPVFAAGIGALAIGYIGMAAVGPFALQEANPLVLSVGHLLALGALLRWAARVELADNEAVTAFYMRVWALFFLEYLLVPAAVLAR